jgi:hypothetical protein
MKNLKHVGKIKNSGSKVLVVFRTLPGESNMALVVQTAPLPDQYHNSIIDLVDSDTGQDSWEFGEILFARPFPDGRPMLQALQADNRLNKISTDNIIMTPTPNTEILLSDLNALIAEQKNCAIDELYTFVKGAPAKSSTEKKVEENVSVAASSNEVLTDRDIARNYRSQADAMYKEAARLRKQADDLDPPAKKAAKAKEAESA